MLYQVICGLLIIAKTAQCSGIAFDYFVFAQQWPQSLCTESSQTHEHDCRIGTNVSTWVVHGLWPSMAHQMGPTYCNKTYTFDPEMIAPIEGVLVKYWPNLFADSPFTDFWKHEWEKHGTCAMSMPILDTEYKYFNFGVKLNRHIDLLKFLSDNGIIPSNQVTYKFSDVESALKTAVGHDVKIECYHHKKAGVQYLLQIEVCIDKQFQPIDCENSRSLQAAEPCNYNTPVSYPIIMHESPPAVKVFLTDEFL